MQKDEIRDKLIELIDGQQDHGEYSRYEDDEGNYLIDFWVSNEELADHLIASGVTIQRWIPVGERLPEDCETVLVYAVGYMELGWYDTDNGEWRSDEYTWDADEVTHWLPLPQTPKEVE